MPDGTPIEPRAAATMSDVAREAGVSRQLVSLVIRGVGYVSPERRRLVLQAAERLGYRRNTLASSLAGRRSQAIGFVVLDIHNQVYADLADGIAQVLDPAGYHLLLALANHRDDAAHGIGVLTGLRVDGLLVATQLPDTVDLAVALGDTPTVILGESKKLPTADVVRGDDATGLRLATEHLLQQGHQDLVYISGPDNEQNHQRASGFTAALRSLGLQERIVRGDATEEGGRRALVDLVRQRRLPTGVVCYNDATAFGVLAGADRERLQVPKDLAVVGYDNTRAAGYPGVQLTSVDQQTPRIGAEAAELLLRRIETPGGDRTIRTVDPRLVVRRSSSRYQPGRIHPPQRDGAR